VTPSEKRRGSAKPAPGTWQLAQESELSADSLFSKKSFRPKATVSAVGGFPAGIGTAGNPRGAGISIGVPIGFAGAAAAVSGAFFSVEPQAATPSRMAEISQTWVCFCMNVAEVDRTNYYFNRFSRATLNTR
jgi:hypothetical protein